MLVLSGGGLCSDGVAIHSPTGGVKPGYAALLCVHTAHVPCRFSKIISRLDKKTGKVAEENPSALGDKDVGTVEFVPLRPLFLEERAVLGPLGRFVMQDRHHIVAFGAVKSVTRAPPIACRPGSLTGAAGAAAEGA
jgi:elongation factor 1-alpha